MSGKAFVDRAIAAAGLDRLLARRIAGDLTADDRVDLSRRLPSIDVLVLGALADRVRAAERGPVVRLHLRKPSDDGAISLPSFDPVAGGIVFLRAVAGARLLSERGARLRVDIDDVGLQLAQVCLAYGADELVAPQRRSIVTDADGDASARAILLERELGALIVAAGREPLVVERKAGETRERGIDEHSPVRKKFRAPGRERDVSSEGEPS